MIMEAESVGALSLFMFLTGTESKEKQNSFP